MQASMPNNTGWIRFGDLTDEIARNITNAQRAEAARSGELMRWDRDYRSRMQRLRREEKLYGNT